MKRPARLLAWAALLLAALAISRGTSAATDDRQQLELAPPGELPVLHVRPGDGHNPPPPPRPQAIAVLPALAPLPAPLARAHRGARARCSHVPDHYTTPERSRGPPSAAVR